jgi:hypothetical protein
MPTIPDDGRRAQSVDERTGEESDLLFKSRVGAGKLFAGIDRVLVGTTYTDEVLLAPFATRNTFRNFGATDRDSSCLTRWIGDIVPRPTLAFAALLSTRPRRSRVRTDRSKHAKNYCDQYS